MEEKSIIKRGGKRLGSSDYEYKGMKKEAFQMYLVNPYLSPTDITNHFNSGEKGERVNRATVSRWMHSPEWHEWFMATLGDQGKALKVRAAGLYEKAINYCEDLLDKNLNEDEAKTAGPTIKLIGHLFEHAGIINQKPFIELNQTTITQNNTLKVSENALKGLTQEQIMGYLTGGEPLKIEDKKEEGDIYDYPEEEFKN